MKYKIKPTKKTLSQLITAGKYDYISSDINKHNLPLGTPAKELELMEIDSYKTTSEIEAMIEQKGFEPATMTDLLHFGAQYPDEQRKHLIAFLGASWVYPDGYREVGCLFGGAGGRFCGLVGAHPADRWAPDFVFAVRARKSPSDTGKLGAAESLEQRVEKLEAIVDKFREVLE